MNQTLTIALAQLNPTVGDLPGNAEQLRQVHAQAAHAGADVVLFPELFLCGYPPEDLVLKPTFLDRVETTVNELATLTTTGGPALAVGAPWRMGGQVGNAVCLLDQGRLAAVRFKHHLPNYRVFDEKRLFTPGPLPKPVTLRGVPIGLPICEDIWFDDVAATLAKAGAELLLVANGSPFESGKQGERLSHAAARAAASGAPLIYLNQVGGQDELVFDGASFVVEADGAVPVTLPSWREEMTLITLERQQKGWRCLTRLAQPPASDPEERYQAMVTGLRDYVNKNGFPGVVLGLSGGVDSALAATVSVDALGAERVLAVMLPSPYTSRESLADATDCAARLGIRLETIPIDASMAAATAMVAPLCGGAAALHDITAQNLQSRLRGLALMALSNQTNRMLVTTGNKSEMATGYATLYGDMCGGYNPVKDLYKTQVYQVSRWRNRHRPEGAQGPTGEVIPDPILTKAPTAELKPNQTDQDSLPSYEVLDDILECLIEQDLGVEEIVARGHDPGTVLRVWGMLDRAEYKRRQAPPGAKLTRRAFGKERRYPITNAFRPDRA